MCRLMDVDPSTNESTANTTWKRELGVDDNVVDHVEKGLKEYIVGCYVC